MPEISRFYGIVIGMFYDEHRPPHFHVRYGHYQAVVKMRSGYLPWTLATTRIGVGDRMG